MFASHTHAVTENLTPYGRLIEEARTSSTRLSQRKAAEAAGISDGWWRQVISGVQKRGTQSVPVQPSRDTLIAMATAVGADVNEVLAAAGMQPEERPRSRLVELFGGSSKPVVAQGWHDFESWATNRIVFLEGVVNDLEERVIQLEVDRDEASQQGQEAAGEVDGSTGSGAPIVPLRGRGGALSDTGATVPEDDEEAAYTAGADEGEPGDDSIHSP